MTPVFADTSYYLALFNRHDRWHEEALAWSKASERPVVVTEFVLVELGNAFCHGRARPQFLALVQTLRADPSIAIVAASSALFDRGLRLFGDRPDKDWSLTDCISFVVMRDEGITEALTADHHFEQAGFTILLGT